MIEILILGVAVILLGVTFIRELYFKNIVRLKEKEIVEQFEESNRHVLIINDFAKQKQFETGVLLLQLKGNLEDFKTVIDGLDEEMGEDFQSDNSIKVKLIIDNIEDSLKEIGFMNNPTKKLEEPRSILKNIYFEDEFYSKN